MVKTRTQVAVTNAERERRRRPQGARRRAELLSALEQLLAERPFDEIEIGDVTARAGVVRSLFYFYFPCKSAAVVALTQQHLDQLMEISFRNARVASEHRHLWLVERIAEVVAAWRAHAMVFSALFGAAAADEGTGRHWTAWTEEFAGRVRQGIEVDQAAGLIELELDLGAITSTLTGMTLSAMERDVRAVARGEPVTEGLVDALVHVWETSIYG